MSLCNIALAKTISVEGSDQGRVFEGIGAVSAGGNSRLLIDYEEPYRSNVCDYLFKPKFGANFHHLKVELGGGTNSTTGAVASHAMTEAELANPVSRSYQLWLMKKARDLNPDIILDCLAWAFPYWFDSEYCQDTSEYIVSFLDLAKNEWGLNMNWVGGCLNEAWSTDNSWLKNSLRPTLDSAGYPNVKIHAEERHGSHYAWQMLDDCMSDPSLDAVVDAVSAHYVEDKAEWPTAAQIAFGKPMWDSEQSSGGGGWSNAIDIVRTMTRDYVEGRITKQEIWCPVDSAPDGVFLGATGAMQADSPWSGAYDLRPAIWGIAHYNQFAEPGWLYIDGGCGTLTGAGNYATLKAPVTDDWSIIIYSESAETLTFQLSGGLSAADVKVWKSTSTNQFIQQSSISQSGGQFTINCSADSLYSLTTTTGQQKGVHSNTTKSDLSLPYSEDFENYTAGQMPSYLSDMQGTSQIQNCKGSRSGLCIQQMVPSVGYGWGTTQQRTQTLIPGPMTWDNYELSSDVYIENGEIYLAVRRGYPSWSWEPMTSGYSFVLEKNGVWALHFDQPDDDSNRLIKYDRGL
ncbi:MAG: galactocerebrosidase [Planctomycetota bacterium]